MNNKQAIEYFSGLMYGAFIKKMIWVASIGDNWKEVDDLFYSAGYETIKELFPDFEGGDVSSHLINTERFGLIAEIHHPRCYDFNYKAGGRPTSWSVSAGICHLSYVYAETLSGLMKAIEKASKKEFEWYIKKDRETRETKVISLNKS